MKRLSIALILSVGAASPAFAHLNPAEHGSFAAGFSHPLFGADHILAMVGVGLWAFLVGGRAVWAIPAAFVVTMMLGFAAALAGIGLPFVEPTIAASVVVLGLLAVSIGLSVAGYPKVALLIAGGPYLVIGAIFGVVAGTILLLGLMGKPIRWH